MVFDVNLSGLKNYLRVPNFILLSMGSSPMMVDPKTQVVDLDVGEMFYNFRLLLVLANYSGVDFGSYLEHKKYQQGTTLCMRWAHRMMVLVLSTYYVVKGLLW